MSDDSPGGSEPAPKKKRGPKVWHEQQELILKSWGESSSCYRYMHNLAFLDYKKSNMRFTLPIIVISTITGTANFAQSVFPTAWVAYVPLVIGAFNLIAAIMTTVLQFLKVSELMESHRVTSIQYGKLARTIRLELAMPLTERKHDGYNMVEICRSEYDRLIEQSPAIPKKILLRFESEISNISQEASGLTVNKPEILTVKPIELFDREKDDEKQRAKQQKILEDLRRERELRMARIPTMFRQAETPRTAVVHEIESLNTRRLVSNKLAGCFAGPVDDGPVPTHAATPEQIAIDIQLEEQDTPEDREEEDSRGPRPRTEEELDV